MGIGRNRVVAFKVSTDEWEAIKRGAEKEKLTLSEYCRACVLRERITDNDLGVIENLVDTVFGRLFGYLKEDTPEAEKKRIAVALFEKKCEEKALRTPPPEEPKANPGK